LQILVLLHRCISVNQQRYKYRSAISKVVIGKHEAADKWRTNQLKSLIAQPRLSQCSTAQRQTFN